LARRIRSFLLFSRGRLSSYHIHRRRVNHHRYTSIII
jgi:hypothetical protein